MGHYLRNVWLFLAGLGRLDQIPYKPGWGPGKFLPLYLLDYGINVVLMAGQVESISRHAQDHRSGKVWAVILRFLERFDPGHGPASGPALWGSQLPPLYVRVLVPAAWLFGVLWLAN
jgi:hypothetical protein